MLNLTATEIDEADVSMKKLLQNAETMRREHPSIDAGPVQGVMDYASSGNVMELAMSHLRESIPSGQRARTELAWYALREAVKHQELWLRQKGYRV